MKKCLLVLLFVSGIYANNNVMNEYFLHEDKINASSSILKDINEAFIFIRDHIDILTTKKGAIGAMLICIPVCCLYSYFFSPQPAVDLLNKLYAYSSEPIHLVADLTGKVHATYGVAYELGKNEAILNSLWSHPSSSLMYIASNGASTLAKYGIPFALGVGIKSFFNIH